MKDISTVLQQPISQIKESVKTVKDSFDRFSGETINKWRIGRRNFP